MKKNDRKKEIVKGLLMVAFAFSVVLIRYWLFPDNEVLKYIALFIGIVFAKRGSDLLFRIDKNKLEKSQEKGTESVDQYEPVPARNYLVLAGIMVGLAVLCFWLSGLPMDIPGLAFFGLVFLMVAVVLLFMAMGRIKVGTDNRNITPAEAEKDTASDTSEDESEGEKTALDLIAETPLMRFFNSKKGTIAISVVMGLCAAYGFVGPYIDPTMTPEDVAAAPYLGIICLLIAVGYPVLHKWMENSNR